MCTCAVSTNCAQCLKKLCIVSQVDVHAHSVYILEHSVYMHARIRADADSLFKESVGVCVLVYAPRRISMYARICHGKVYVCTCVCVHICLSLPVSLFPGGPPELTQSSVV